MNISTNNAKACARIDVMEGDNFLKAYKRNDGVDSWRASSHFSGASTFNFISISNPISIFPHHSQSIHDILISSHTNPIMKYSAAAFFLAATTAVAAPLATVTSSATASQATSTAYTSATPAVGAAVPETPATPYYDFVGLQLSDEVSGANTDVNVTVDGVPQSLQDLFLGTAVEKNGVVLATSAQLVQNFQGIDCKIELANGDVLADLNTNSNFSFLLNGQEVNVDGDTITCNRVQG